MRPVIPILAARAARLDRYGREGLDVGRNTHDGVTINDKKVDAAAFKAAEAKCGRPFDALGDLDDLPPANELPRLPQLPKLPDDCVNLPAA